MMQIPCPWCGRRDATEFGYLGEQRRRPEVESVTAEDWRAYLYLRDNTADPRTETWYHRTGCRQYLTVVRDPVGNSVLSCHPSRDPGNAS